MVPSTGALARFLWFGGCRGWSCRAFRRAIILDNKMQCETQETYRVVIVPPRFFIRCHSHRCKQTAMHVASTRCVFFCTLQISNWKHVDNTEQPNSPHLPCLPGKPKTRKVTRSRISSCNGEAIANGNARGPCFHGGISPFHPPAMDIHQVAEMSAWPVSAQTVSDWLGVFGHHFLGRGGGGPLS